MFQVFTRRTAIDLTPAGNPPLDRQEPKAARPKIGLALGGGAARGWAHIGVIKALVANVNKRRILGLMDFRLGGAGLIGGGRLAELLLKTIGPLSVEDLPVRYAAIATEVGTGHEIWLTQGTLTDAMRASYAMPGIFSPVKVAGRWLMDGALVNPIPVSAARALGARIVIAVNLNAEVFGRGTVIQNHGFEEESSSQPVPVEVGNNRFGTVFRIDRLIRRQFFGEPNDGPRGISAVMIDAFNITQDRIARSRLAGDPPDVMISPKLSRIGLFEFHQAARSIELGAEATERALGELGEAIAALV